MKIVDNRRPTKNFTFMDVLVGQFFQYDYVIYLKTSNSLDANDVNAFDTNQECRVFFQGDEDVQLLNVELHIV